MQQDRNRSRPYDQNRDTLRSSAPSQRSTPLQSSGGGSSRYGYNGEPLSRPPSRTAGGEVRRSRTDNSIQFPGAQQTQSRNAAQSPSRQRSRSGGQQSSLRVANGGAARAGSPKRRTSAQNTAREPNRTRSAQPGQQRYKNQRLRPAQAQQHSPARREGRKKRKVTRATLRRRRILRRLTAFAMLLCVIGAGIYLTMTMLFRVNSIQVQTTDGTQVSEIAGYSAQSILQVLDVQMEQNIFSFEPSAKEAVLEQQFPLLESIKVVRDYPNTVVVRVTEATPTYAVQEGSRWLVVSDTFKILSTEDSQPQGLCTLYGGTVQDDAPGQQLLFGIADEAAAGSDSAASQPDGEATQEALMNALETLRSKLEEYGMLADVTRMEFADTEQIAILYQDRISVLLGTLNDLDYKLDRARYVLTNADGKGCGPTDTGRLDFSHISAGSTRKIYFAQGEPTLPSGYVAPPKTEDTTTEPETTESTDTAEADGETTADAAQTDGDAAAADELPLTDPARMTANVDENPM